MFVVMFPDVQTHTGVGGDAKRWRFPWPYTSLDWSSSHPHIGGEKFSSGTLAGCQADCDTDADCKGVYFGGSTCYTLHSLIEADTGLAGNSYTREPPPPPAPSPAPSAAAPLVVCSEPEVFLLARRSTPSDTSPVVAVHLVDWRRAANWSTGVLINETFAPISVNLSNAMFKPSEVMKAPCGQLNMTLHTLDSTSVAVKGECDEDAGVTSLSMAAPEPWALLEVRPRSTQQLSSRWATRAKLDDIPVRCQRFTVCGHSSGGMMASNHFFAFSGRIDGLAQIESGSYASSRIRNSSNATQMLVYAQQSAAAGRIAPLTDAANKPIWVMEGAFPSPLSGSYLLVTVLDSILRYDCFCR